MKRAVFAVVVVLAAASCLSSTSVSNIGIYSWWVSGDEEAALNKLIHDFDVSHPNIAVTNAEAANAQSAQTDLANRMRDGNPPGTFQVNPGVELFDYLPANELDNLDDLAARLDWHNPNVWSTTVMGSVQEGTTQDYYAVPVNIARVNAVFYNTTYFDDPEMPDGGQEMPDGCPKMTIPTNLEQFEKDAEALRDSCGMMYPLAIGAQTSWTLEVIFKGCLVAEAELADGAGNGVAYYKEFAQGYNQSFLNGSPDPIFDSALQCFAHIVGYADPMASPRLTWDVAVDSVGNGDAAMTIMGEWAIGQFTFKHMSNFAEGPFPGSAETFIYTVDAFTLPHGARDPGAVKALLTDWGSAATQQDFVGVKGTIAARMDVDASAYSPLQQKNLRAFQSADSLKQLVPDFPLAVPSTFTTNFDTALAQFVSDGNAENVVLVVRNNYYLLASQEDRWW